MNYYLKSNKALPLRDCILDIKGTEVVQATVINNMVDIYNLEFTMETAENLFEFIETIVGDDWENWKVITDEDSKRFYYIGEESDTQLPPPATIGDFIEDCNRVWKKDLVWEGNLIKRYFSYEH